MDMLSRIKMEYDLSELTWIKENTIFQSERGKKRIRIWKDKQLLEWHVNWRDEISKQSGFLLDRMIRTRDRKPFFICDKDFVSIHDEIVEPYPTKGKEQEWGRLIGHALTYGINQSNENHCFKKSEPLPLKTVRGSLEQLSLLDPMAKLVLERSYLEAKKRNEKANLIQKRVQEKKLPVLTNFSKLEDARQVFFHLYWICGSEQPIRGYKTIRNLLEKWYSKNGNHSTVELLDSINRYFSLKEDHGLLLLSELLMPHEFEETVAKLFTCKSVNEMPEIINQYFSRWKTTRELVILLSKWIEKDGERVVAK
ncbi:hypothetical protein BKP37_18825 [Anaerobacillus alkalilacustris]|uniref:Uncharacterized protein n=1 Tax=Anaerobacillus alkalilacustris TaxID=393763 RepID=A0A1S2LE00_9BACI|nr:hypothetical protein [Anaerobacillus alkalilacustris]OIJ10586.1 hypothetical protein BKP37_18825 [Anaerobacillus alkalilacustris]